MKNVLQQIALDETQEHYEFNGKEILPKDGLINNNQDEKAMCFLLNPKCYVELGVCF